MGKGLHQRGLRLVPFVSHDGSPKARFLRSSQILGPEQEPVQHSFEKPSGSVSLHIGSAVQEGSQETRPVDKVLGLQ
jgi:hypothetical protein